jgi:cobyrinic acid a,c-diamide synthase
VAGGLLVAAPSSGAGKTVVTLGLLRALRRAGVAVRGAKSGPDYIDGRFLEAACGAPCPNLDAWAMPPARLRALAWGPGTLIVEGAMGLFDGAPGGRGSAAELARTLGLPVLLVIDISGMAQSAGALAAGFARADPGLRVAGALLNRAGSERHAREARRAVEAAGVPVLGVVARDPALLLPSRHLGLVQAEERPDLEGFLERAADRLAAAADLPGLLALAAGAVLAPAAAARLPPPAGRIAIAQDAGFAFAYPHQLADWRAGGAEILPFSPLADEPVPEAELVLLPGGYPELHAGRLAGATRFLGSLRRAAERVPVHGECGGYMVLGEALIDAAGQAHAMAGLLPLVTSLAERRLQLGYRLVTARGGPFPGAWAAHEFHFATILREAGEPLFDAEDAEGAALPPMGLRRGLVSGSFAHLIDRAMDGAAAAR